MRLALGPLQYYWPREAVLRFYEPEPVTPPTEEAPIAEPTKPVPPVVEKMPVRKAEVVKKNSTDTSKKSDATPAKSSSKSTPSARGSGTRTVKKPFRLNP